MKEGEQYGKWFIASFSDSGFQTGRQRKQFALSVDSFLREFELSFHMHTLRVEFRELNESDLIRAIQEILT